MKVLCAPDKLRGACTQSQAARAMVQGVQDAGGEGTALPVADGGEGTLQVMAGAFPDLNRVRVRGPIHGQEAYFRCTADGRHALIESAQACGLAHLQPLERDPGLRGTTGVGQLIRAALDLGAEQITLALGGSASCDAGIGMATELGARFLDGDGHPVDPVGDSLSEVRGVDLRELDPRLEQVELRVWCDVAVPLWAPRGRDAGSFLMQKGATSTHAVRLRDGLRLFSHRLGLQAEAGLAGAGAAGGLGFGARAFLGGRLLDGADAVLDHLGVDGLLETVDLCLTAEGAFDVGSRDKVVGAVATRCVRAGVPVVVLAGRIEGPPMEGVQIVALSEGLSRGQALAEALPRLRTAAADAVRAQQSPATT